MGDPAGLGHSDTKVMPSPEAESVGVRADSLRAIGAALWRDADRALLWTGLAIGTLAPLSAGLVFLDARVLDGMNVWLKPLKFQMSVSVFLITMALMIPLASRAFRRGPFGRGAAWVAITTGVFEIVWITLRAALGERSHYADGALGGFMYGAMGLAAVLLSLTPVVLAVGIMLTTQDEPWRRVVRWGVVLGTLVSLVGAAGIGFMLGGSPGHYPADARDAASRLPLAGWSVERGDLRIAHFVGLHALQGLFLAGVLMARMPLGRARLLLAGGAVVWLGTVVGLAAMAIRGVSPLAPLAPFLGLGSP